ECDSEPCLNGATCYESVKQGQFVCICPPFYTGDFCHQRFSPCELPYNPCINNSTCLAQADGNPMCICKTGYEGTYCEVNSNECMSHPCQNEGLCVDGVNSYRCSCQHGFTGTLCEVEINECLSRPCKNSGTCLDLINRFLCNCTPGYYGSLCEIDVNECETLPCLNGGSCINRLGGYQCFCSPGFTGIIRSLPHCKNKHCRYSSFLLFFSGSNCEFRPCEASNPCENGAMCTEEMNLDAFPLGFQCQCVKGFAGPRCEINVNECSSNPCLHGYCYDSDKKYFLIKIICKDMSDGYVCFCAPGFIGRFNRKLCNI
uniref:EGF-like domain-containing protein n=1 Tax=Meleagris gallopavo TaxID=9103 RepID=G1NM73_MELGA